MKQTKAGSCMGLSGVRGWMTRSFRPARDGACLAAPSPADSQTSGGRCTVCSSNSISSSSGRQRTRTKEPEPSRASRLCLQAQWAGSKQASTPPRHHATTPALAGRQEGRKEGASCVGLFRQPRSESGTAGSAVMPEPVPNRSVGRSVGRSLSRYRH